MEINKDKINTMIIKDKKNKNSINIEGKKLKQVKRFKNLRKITDEKGTIN